MTIEEAMQQIRDPEILQDESKLREILASLYESGKRSVRERSPMFGERHGMIRFSDGAVRTV